MAVLTAPNAPAAAGHRSRSRWLRKLRDAAGLVATVALTQHKASVRRLADMPLTCLGTAGIDFAAFHITHGWGWLVTGVSLVVVEHLISDPDDSGPA